MTRRIEGPVVGGIPLVTEIPEDLEYIERRAPRWRGAGDHGEPLVFRYEVAPLPEALRASVAGPGAERYFVDGAEGLSYLGHPAGEEPRQWMLTVRPGHEYVVRFESTDDLNKWEWWWKRRVWMFALAVRGRGLALHCTLFLLPDGRAVACPGVSGAGKSTIARLLAATADVHGARVLSDDRAAIVRDADGTLHAWSTPWYSSAAAATEGHGPLAALILLRHAHGAVLEAADPAAMGQMLMRTLALPFWSEPALADALGMLDALLGTTLGREFHFAPTTDEVAALIPRLLSALDTP